MRIAAHAFAENRPARDLVVSPGHSIAVDLLGEVLIPASSLINGTTIRQESAERVTYWHVELESHDLLVTENLPTESYLDMGNRGFFPRPGEATGPARRAGCGSRDPRRFLPAVPRHGAGGRLRA